MKKSLAVCFFWAFATIFPAVVYSAEPENIAAMMERGKALAETQCAACHSVDGNSIAPTFPKIASQHEDYMTKQLMSFKGHTNLPMRENAVMAGQVENLSDEDLKAVSVYYSQQVYKPATASKPETRALAEKLYRSGDGVRGLAACAACHGPAGQGIPGRYPRIAGQFPEYLKQQLVAFRSGTRQNDPEGIMQSTTQYLTDKEIDALSDYVAGLRLAK